MAVNSPRQWRRWMWPQPIRYAHLNLLMTFSLNVDFLASQKHRSYSRIFYPPNSAKLNKSFKILFTKDYGLLPYSKELLNIHYLLLLSTLPCPLRRQKLTYIFYSLICWSEANCITFFAGIKGKWVPFTFVTVNKREMQKFKVELFSYFRDSIQWLTKILSYLDGIFA